MEHVVFYPTPDGSPAFRRLPSLEEAVRLVEHLRNVEGVSEVSCHALTEVPLAFKAYYRVEIPAETTAQAPAVPVAPVEPPPVAVAAPAEAVAEPVQVVADAAQPALAAVPDQPVADEAVPALASSNGHAPGRASLGFFSR